MILKSGTDVSTSILSNISKSRRKLVRIDESDENEEMDEYIEPRGIIFFDRVECVAYTSSHKMVFHTIG